MNWQEVFTSAIIAAILSTAAVITVVVLAVRHEKRFYEAEKRMNGSLAEMQLTLNGSAQKTDRLLRDWDMLTHGQQNGE